MSEWPFRYPFLGRDELEAELFALCLRLRRTRTPSELGGRPPDGEAAAAPDIDGAAARRCYMSLRDCPDTDFPRLLEADERVRALIGTLNEAASLLHSFAHAGQSGRGRRFPS